MAPRNETEDYDCGGVMAPMTDDYNQLNKSQSTVWKFAKPLFARALENLSLPDAKSFRVADLGCATGGNSVAPLSFVSSQVGQVDPKCALEVFMGDLPPNAWSSVVETVTPEKITEEDDRASNTYVYMIGRTFYECCAPAASLDLSYSLVAVHWMESYAGDIPTGLYATDPVQNSDSTLLQAWQEAGARDFMKFTQARYKELKVGGRFIGAVACPKENGDMPWSKVAIPIYRALQAKFDNAEALASCVLPCCYRTEADVRAGFNTAGWELEACEFHQTKDPVRESLEQGELSPMEYARAVIKSFKAVCHPTCIGSLSKYMPLSNAEELLAAAYQDSLQDIAADPELYNLDVSFWYVMAKKAF